MPTAFAVAALLVLASCHKMPLTAPSGSAITLIAETNVLPVNGSTTITAVVLQGGLTQSGTATTTTSGVGLPVHNGTVVSFTTSLGRIEPAEATTEAGKATATLIAEGRSGVATITAFSGSATKTLTVNIGAAGATRIVVSASPQSLPATGGQSTITANVQDQQGNGLLGVPVTFAVTSGGSAGSPGSLSATSALTDSAGNATTTLTTSQGPVTVTASAGGGTGTLTGTVTVSVRAKTNLTITPPASIIQSVPAAFTVGVGTGTVVTDVKIDFGDGLGSVDLGAISANTSVIHLFGDPHIYTVSATATDTDGGKTTVTTQVAVSSLNLTATATPTSVALGGSIIFSVIPQGSISPAITGYQWDFGEGDAPVQTTASQVSHVFKSVGTKTVTITVFPTAGKPITLLVNAVVS